MTTNKFFTISVLALLLLVTSGCGTTSKQTRTNNQASDSTITANVVAAAKEDTKLNSSAINVETSNGVVSLSGSVGSHAEVIAATDIARAVAGVTGVKNNMMVKTIR